MILLAALLLSPMIAQASGIRDSSVIALVRIEAANAHPWAAGPKQTRVRTVDLELAVERTLKGRARAQHFRLTVEQSQPGPRDAATPGLWSGKSIEPSTRMSTSDEHKSRTPYESRAERRAEIKFYSAAITVGMTGISRRIFPLKPI